MIVQRKPTLLFPILFAILVIVLAAWAYFAIISGNPVFFVSPERFYKPDRIVVLYYGTPIELQPGSEAFRETDAALNRSLRSFRGRISIGLSEGTLTDYREGEYALEVFFSYDIGPVIGRSVAIDHLLIPIDGRHSGNGFVFTGDNGKWQASALIMEDPVPVLKVLSDLGYLTKD